MARKKKAFNPDALTQKQLKELSLQVGENVREICDKAVTKANKILAKYNMETKMAFVIKEKGGFDQPAKNEATNLSNVQELQE